MKRANNWMLMLFIAIICFLLLSGCSLGSASLVFPHNISLGMSADQVYKILGQPDDSWSSDDDPTARIDYFYVESTSRPEHFDTNSYIKSDGPDTIQVFFSGKGNSAKVVSLDYIIPVSEDLDRYSSEMDLINSVVESYANYLIPTYGEYDSSVSYGNQVYFEWPVKWKNEEIWVSLSGPFPSEGTYEIRYTILGRLK